MNEAFQRGDGQSESYFISFTDLLIGVIFLFIIILLAYGLNFRSAEMRAAEELFELQQERDRLRLDKQELENEKEALEAKTLAVDNVAQDLVRREEWRDEMLRELARALAGRGVEVVLDLEKGVLRLPEALLFASGSADLTGSGEAALRKLAAAMSSIMPCYVSYSKGSCSRIKRPIVETILIEGHTDSVPIRSAEFGDNWELSVARGVNTYKALTAAGRQLDTFRNARNEAILGVSGYETRRPVAGNDKESDRERNRRIDLRFLISAPDPSQLQTLSPSFLPPVAPR